MVAFSLETSVNGVKTTAASLIEKTRIWEESYVRALTRLSEKLPKIEEVLGKLGLVIDTFNQYKTGTANVWADGDKLAVSIRAKSTGKFKFLTFRGYTARGSGKNQEALDHKATKIKEAIDAAGDVYSSVNPFSLEVRDRDNLDNKAVMIDFCVNA